MLTVCGALFSNSSARSRVRGNLEIYHAYLHDDTISNNEVEDNNAEERDWEIVDGGRVENPAQVSKNIYEKFYLAGIVL